MTSRDNYLARGIVKLHTGNWRSRVKMMLTMTRNILGESLFDFSFEELSYVSGSSEEHERRNMYKASDM